jgi:hypothetical protein
MSKPTAGFEVHEHSFISGPRRGRISHSHEGGNAWHEHPDTGPASYTIDKDDWFKATGLRGGGRKKFTPKPTGEQLPTIPRIGDFFRVVIMDPPCPPGHKGEGGAMVATARIAAKFRMPFTVEAGPPTRGGMRKAR